MNRRAMYWGAGPAVIAACLGCNAGGSSPAVHMLMDAGADVGEMGLALDPGRKEPHRLNSTEYNATVRDVLGTKRELATGSLSEGESDGFDNTAAVQHVDATQYQRYFAAANDLATEVMASKELRARFVSCALADDACVASSLQAAGLRLFRRPLDADELGTYRRVYDAARGLGDDEASAFS